MEKKSQEEQHSQHICVLKKLLGRNEIDTEELHLEEKETEGSEGGRNIDCFIIVSQTEALRSFVQVKPIELQLTGRDGNNTFQVFEYRVSV